MTAATVPTTATAGVLNKLQRVRRAGAGWSALCPAHDDKRASLSVDNGADGRALIHCHAGCPPDAIIGALGLATTDLFEEPTPKSGIQATARTGGIHTTRYEIRDAAGALAAVKVRTDPGKAIRWERPDGRQGLNGTATDDLPLYLSELAGTWAVDEPVVVTEGEKDAEAVRGAGLAAVGTVTGAGGTPSAEPLAVLAGMPVVLWPDADAVGGEHMARIAERVRAVAAGVRIVRWSDPPTHAGAADLPAERIRELVAAAEPYRWTMEEQTGAQRLSALSVEPPPPLLIDRLDPEGHTILYGPGGAGKGTLAAWWVIQLTRDGHRVLILDYEHHPTEWSRRIHGLGGADLMSDIWYVAPTGPDWQGPRGAIWDQADALAALVREVKADVALVDSLAYACVGADITDGTTPPRYGAAVDRIGAVPLSLAHVPKGKDANLGYPFGSVFWHNGARMTWSLELNGERRVLTCRKSNNYQPAAAQEVAITWLDNLPRDVLERAHHVVLAERIAACLGGERMTVRQIHDALAGQLLDESERAPSEGAIRTTLNRGRAASPPTFDKIGETWGNA
jgi:hypothetical protein